MTRIEVETVKVVMGRAYFLETFTKQDLMDYLRDTKLSEEAKEKAISYFLTSSVVAKTNDGRYSYIKNGS